MSTQQPPKRTMYFLQRTHKDSFIRPVKTSRDAKAQRARRTVWVAGRETEQERIRARNPSTMKSEPEAQPISVGAPLADALSHVRLAPQTSAQVSRLTQPDRHVLRAKNVEYERLQRWRRQRQSYRYRLLLRYLSRRYLQQAWANEHKATRRFWLILAVLTFVALILLLSMSGAITYAAYRFYTSTEQHYGAQVLTLADLLPRDNLKMYDRNGILIGQLADQGLHTTVTLQHISPMLINATIATEDKNFWTNPGIDMQGILRAALDDARSGRIIEGGSTITQQLIKNLLVGDSVTIQRKIEELMLVPQINLHYSKQEILQMYLNSIYYGEQAYGIDAAATVYFGLEDQPGRPAAAQLDIAQAAMLAGLPRSPYQYDPRLHPQAAFERFQTVLLLMEQQGYITRVQQLDAIKEEQQPHFFKTAPNLVNRAPHFFNFVLTQLEPIFHLTRAQLSRSDMQVYTTLDITLQDKIQKIMQQHIAALRYTHNVTNAAEVLLDFHTGAIISLLGSIDYYDQSIDGQFDVATQAYRQPGSSFKPYVYVTAFAQGISPAQTIDDAPLTIILPPGTDPPTFSPTNYDLHYHGLMTLRCALQNSLNVPAVKVLQHAGISAAMQTAYNMGVTSYQGTPGYSLVLGGLGIRLIDQVSGYGTFANGGIHVPYYAIQKVVFATSQQTYVHANNLGTRAISPQLAYMMTSVLSDNQDRIPEFYDCNVLQLYSNSQQECWAGNRGTVRPAAAKTGTTTDFRDNWTIGYTTDYVMGVWAGNDNNSPMWNITGVDGAAPIWHDAMLVAEQGHPIRNFTNPGGLLWATVTYPDGVHTSDWFLPGTVPIFRYSLPTTIGTPDETPTPSPVNNQVPVTSHPYCPSYSFAWQPPANSASLASAGSW
jgi:membrane peptidoglycan carboxypeptidase